MNSFWQVIYKLIITYIRYVGGSFFVQTLLIVDASKQKKNRYIKTLRYIKKVVYYLIIKFYLKFK